MMISDHGNSDWINPLILLVASIVIVAKNQHFAFIDNLCEI